jgi:hypothetical protein
MTPEAPHAEPGPSGEAGNVTSAVDGMTSGEVIAKMRTVARYLANTLRARAHVTPTEKDLLSRFLYIWADEQEKRRFCQIAECDEKTEWVNVHLCDKHFHQIGRGAADEEEAKEALPDSGVLDTPTSSFSGHIDVHSLPTRPCHRCGGVGSLDHFREEPSGCAGVTMRTNACPHCGGGGRELVVGPAE